MPVETNQKAFYDKLRDFQAKDWPGNQPEVSASVPDQLPVGQLIAGVIVLGLIALTFFKFAIPSKPDLGPPQQTPTVAAPAHK